jgi:long-chain acyl-CoA synthetase
MIKGTLYTILQRNIEKYGLKPALYYESPDKKWMGISWFEMGAKIMDTAKALLEMQINTGDRIALFSQNMPEWTITDYAIQAIRAVSVPLYATTSIQQALYILDETETKILFVGEQEQYDKALKIAKNARTIKKIVVFSSETILSDEFDSSYYTDFCKTGNNPVNSTTLKQRIDEGNNNDLLTIIYTSGTSGEPKGVMLSQSNLLFCIEIHKKRVILNDSDISMCFLPLSHIFERGWTFVVLSSGITNYYLKNPKEVIDKIREVKPNLMCAVPRFFEKTYTAVLNTLEKSSPLKRKIFTWAIRTGYKKLEYVNSGNPVPFSINFKYRIADILVLKKGRSALGGCIRYMPCAGASLSEEIVRFFHSVGITILYGYGLTETTATISCFTYTGFKFGSVGRIMPDLDVKIGENNEILIKGGSVTSGYYNNPKATEEAFINGWFRTGDAGTIDDEGNIFLTDRIKDIFKTSSGKFITPQSIENILGNSPFIDQVAIIGNEKKYITALIVPAFDTLKDYAVKNNIKSDNRSELLKNEKVQKFYEDTINKLQKDLSPFEQVKKFTLLPVEFTINGGELTDTLKIKRKVITQKYDSEIALMYPE